MAVAFALACALAGAASVFAAASVVSSSKPAVWQPPAGAQQVPIWNGAAPDPVANPKPESVGPPPGSEWWPRANDVSVPTMTVFPPKGKSAHAAVIVFPGGGFKFVAMDLEGTEICDWLTARGITCVLSKYRVPDTNHHWDDACQCGVTPKIPRALQDAQRTIRLVRSQAKRLNVEPSRIGVIGFSAGGYLVAQTSNIFVPAYKQRDAIDAISSRPDFAMALYPGHLCRRGNSLDPGIHVTKKTPPTFLLQAWDDPVDPVCNSTVYARALDQADVPSEIHLFAGGGHAFGLRKSDQPVASWPVLAENWLKAIGILKP